MTPPDTIIFCDTNPDKTAGVEMAKKYIKFHGLNVDQVRLVCRDYGTVVIARKYIDRLKAGFLNGQG
jgi:hypothetical protein